MRPRRRQPSESCSVAAASYEDVASVTLAPFRPDLVSVPPDVTGSPLVSSLLREDAVDYLRGGGERMLRPQVEVDELVDLYGPVKPYNDPTLFGSARRYQEFVKKLAGCGLLRFTREPIEMIGIFFVWKKERRAQRLILDARRAKPVVP